jgi:serine/threonine protein phosphatase PrpC
MTTAEAKCPSCGSPVRPEDNFCEACRAELRPAMMSGASAAGSGVGCPSCPGAAVTPEGYCETCGRKLPAGDDHAEIDLGLVAGVTDRGLRHRRNEDAMALATARTPGGPAVIAVVCDGVSSSSRADEASKAAAQAAMQVLLGAVRTGGDVGAAARGAFESARTAVAALADGAGLTRNSPSATLAAAVVTGRDVTVCWLGDSRVYWLDAEEGASSRRLTSDDSVAQELVARGLLSEDDALASPVGHVVTAWIGADMSDAEPHVTTFEPGGAGVVLLCSDGLWNYGQEAADLASRALPAALTNPLEAAAALVTFANEAGGADNITAVLVPFPPSEDGPDQPVPPGAHIARAEP